MNLDELIEEYRNAYESIPKEALELDLRATFSTIRALAKGNPVNSTELAALWGMPPEHVQSILAGAVEAGSAEVDDQGDLVGGVLSLNPTAHRITMDDTQLYAWCAYDAIYAPAIVGTDGFIESHDPVTGELIRVTITPGGVEEVEPATTVVSVVGAKTDLRGGPNSPRCSQMLFFASRESADRWLQGRSQVAILTVEEVFGLAEEFQIELGKRLGLF